MHDSEALRVLRLLQVHHEKLAGIVRAHSNQHNQKKQSRAQSPSGRQPSKHDEAASDDARSTRTGSGAVTGPERSHSQSGGETNREKKRAAHKEHKLHGPRVEAQAANSSIAGNLATARGIPSVQQRAARQALRQSQAASVSPRGQKKADAAEDVEDKEENLAGARDEGRVAGATVKRDAQDDAFTKFYSAFSPLLSRLSAPLAFTGLPLHPQTEQQTSALRAADRPEAPEPAAQKKSAADATDVTPLFSPAALRALRSSDDNPPFSSPPHESFYVVPTAGGTVSYANMLSRSQHPAHAPPAGAQRAPLAGDPHAAGAGEGEAEHFVDAPSTLPSSRASKKDGGQWQRRIEELETENASLKGLTDGLSRRLYMWERSAQGQAEALRRSMRFLQPGASSAQLAPALAPHDLGDGAEGGRGYKDEVEVERRVKELEGEVARWKRETERCVRENEKLKAVVGKYRNRWEKLREGARVRRTGSGERVAQVRDGVEAGG